MGLKGLERTIWLLAAALLAGAVSVQAGTPVTETVPVHMPPKTLEVVDTAPVLEAPGGAVRERWAAGTLLTSDRRRGDWVRVTGHFPHARWRPMTEAAWIHRSLIRRVRPAAPKRPVRRSVSPGTFSLTREVLVRDGPGGREITRWSAGRRFTVRKRQGKWLKVSGHFPDGAWEPMDGSRWVPAEAARDIQAPEDIPLPYGAERYIVVDKSDFELRVVQEREGELEVLFATEVGLGMDDCLPPEQGGSCYYTETGEYHVRWRIYEPEGIDWCIPDSMAREPEYAADLARGKRCFEGVLGRFALNIGKSYAIHGTRDLESLGKKATHGCIRARPQAVKTVWRYMREGDRVVIQE